MTSKCSDYSELEGLRIGDYVIEQCIGVGGQAVVFMAHDADYREKKYALKVFGLKGSDFGDGIRECLKEAEILANMDHPSVVRFHRPQIGEVSLAGADHEIFYLPMDFANGGSCDEAPPFKVRHLSVSDLQLMIDLLDGLQMLHEHGITHEDLKPANILQFNRRANNKDHVQLRITDFGIAKIHSALESRAEPGGMSPPFMCPEQPDRDRTDTALVKQGDIYSMGATLYYMITGELPIKPAGSRPTLVAWQEAHRTLPRPNATKSVFCPPRLALLIMRMMGVAPEERPGLEECKDEIRKIIKTRDLLALNRLELPEKLEKALARNEFPIRYVPDDFRGIFKPGVHEMSEASQLFVIRIKMVHPIYGQYKMLVDFMVKRFSDTFSLHETWGTYDINMLVWSKTEDIKSLKSELSIRLPGCDMQIRLATEVHDFHCTDRDVPDGANPVHALAVQEGVTLPGLKPEEYLCKSFPEEFPENSIRAFTYVEPAERHNIRNAIIRNVQYKLEEIMRKDRRRALDERKFHRMSMIELAPLDFMLAEWDKTVLVVSYVATRYKHLAVVPTEIIDALGETAVKTSSSLETRRVVFQSDKILM